MSCWELFRAILQVMNGPHQSGRKANLVAWCAHEIRTLKVNSHEEPRYFFWDFIYFISHYELCRLINKTCSKSSVTVWNLTERSKWCSRCSDIHSHGDCYFCGPCIHVHIGQTFCDISRLILGLHPANERRCYFVKTSLTDLDGCKPKISPVIALQNYSLLILLFIANMVLSQFTLPYLCGGKLQYFNVVDPMRVHIQCIVFHTIQDIFTDYPFAIILILFKETTYLFLNNLTNILLGVFSIS